MWRRLGRLMALTFVGSLGLTATGPASCADGEPKRIQAEPTVTAKERLSGKANDEQRVDNCKVPPERRGSKPRPDSCRTGAGPGSKR
jgi:hypothetical protein